MPKNVKTTTQLQPFHMLANFFMPGFKSMWTQNFQMYQLDLERAEELDIKLPTSIES